MTLKNSSSTESVFGFKSMTKRRLAVVIPVALYFFSANILGTIFTLNHARWDTGAFRTAERLLAEMRAAYLSITGYSNVEIIFVFGIAVLLSLNGFVYLYDRGQVDFYESQPMRRKDRFFAIWKNGFFIFLIPYAVSLLISLLLAGGYGIVNGALVTEVFLTFVRTVLYFLAIYHIGILAAVLTGNLLIAVLMTMYLLFAEMAGRLLVTGYMAKYCATYVGRGMGEITMLSPIYNYVQGARLGTRAWIADNAAGGLVRGVFANALPMDAVVLFLAVLTVLFARFLYLRRRNETAGQALSFSQASPFVKWPLAIGAGLLTGLAAGVFFMSSTGEVSEQLPLTLFLMVFIAFIVCCTAEAVFDFNIRSIFAHFWQIPCILALTVFIFFFFRNDMAGYDRYVPAEGKLESAALVMEESGSVIYAEGVDSLDYAEEYMFLEDKEVIRTLGEIGQANCGYAGWSGTMVYRLRNGKKVYRLVCFPYDTDEKLLDAVTSSEAFREGTFPIYHEEEFAPSYNGGEMIFTGDYTDVHTLTIPVSRFPEFAAAYREDLKNYRFSTIRRDPGVGQISVNFQIETESDYRYYSQTYPVYACFTKTIAFLQAQEGAFPIPTAWGPSEIASITLYPATPYEGMYVDGMLYSVAVPEGEQEEIVITDKREIEKLSTYYQSGAWPSSWKDDKYFDNRYEVEITTDWYGSDWGRFTADIDDSLLP